MTKLLMDIECLGCKRKFEMKVEDIRPGKSIKCTKCGTQIKFSGDAGRKMQKAMDKFEKMFK